MSPAAKGKKAKPTAGPDQPGEFYGRHEEVLAPTLHALAAVERNTRFVALQAEILPSLGYGSVARAGSNSYIVVNLAYEASRVIEAEPDAFLCVSHKESMQDDCTSIVRVVKRVWEGRA